MRLFREVPPGKSVALCGRSRTSPSTSTMQALRMSSFVSRTAGLTAVPRRARAQRWCALNDPLPPARPLHLSRSADRGDRCPPYRSQRRCRADLARGGVVAGRDGAGAPDGHPAG